MLCVLVSLVIHFQGAQGLAGLKADYCGELEAKTRVSRSLDETAIRESKRSLQPDDRAFVEFRLAWIRQPGPHVQRMVSAAKRSMSNGRDYVPYALGRLYLNGRLENDALQALLTLRLDGGPAEFLSDVRLDLIAMKPLPIARALRKLARGKVACLFSPRQIPEFTEDASFLWREDPRVSELSKKYEHSKDLSLRFLSDYLDVISKDHSK